MPLFPDDPLTAGSDAHLGPRLMLSTAAPPRSHLVQKTETGDRVETVRQMLTLEERIQVLERWVVALEQRVGQLEAHEAARTWARRWQRLCWWVKGLFRG
jgi:hypothetical protein